MPSLALACVIAFVVATTTAAHGRAQSLRAKLEAAAVLELPTELAALLAAPAPLPPIVDALVADRTREGRMRARPFMMLVETRRKEVEELWRSDQDARIQRAELFAQLGAQFLLDRHEQGDTTELLDLAAVVAFLPQGEQLFLGVIRAEGVPMRRRHSAEMLQRAFALAARQRANPTIDMLRCVSGTPEELDKVWLYSGGGCYGVSAFHLAALLTDENPTVRRRAMAMLRLSMYLPLPQWLGSALRCDPAPNVRSFAANWPMTQAELEWLLARLAADDPRVPLLSNDASRLSAKDVERLAAAMIASGSRRSPPQPATADALRGYARAAESVRCFQAAATLGPRLAAAVLATAVHAPSPAATLAALYGVDGLVSMGAETAEAVAPLLATLLDHRDPEVSRAAARIATRVIAAAPVPALRERIVAIAEDALAAQKLATMNPGFCGMPPRPRPSPANTAAQVVFAAAVAGDQRITKALLARWRAPHDDDEPDFTLLCLARLGSGMAPDLARDLHSAIVKQYAPRLTVPERHEAAPDVLFSLFVAVPDDVLPWYRDFFSDDHLRTTCSRCTAFAHVRVPSDRLPLLLEPLVTNGTARPLDAATVLYFDAPERVAAAWRAGGDAARSAINVVASCWREDAARVEALVATGAWPRALAASSVNSASAPFSLSRLAAVVPNASESRPAWGYVEAIERAPATNQEDDLTALEKLATAADPGVALAAARRAATFGARGIDIASRTLTRQLELAGEDLERTKAVVAVCAVTGASAHGLQAAIPRLRATTDWYALVLADAADMRLFGLHPAAAKTDHTADAIAAAHIDVDAFTLDSALRNGPPLDLALPRLFGNCSPITMASGLDLAAAIPVWSVELEACVTKATLHLDPRVRRAAYLALRSRDRDLFPCALLVCEAAFDPDPAVRDVAR